MPACEPETWLSSFSTTWIGVPSLASVVAYVLRKSCKVQLVVLLIRSSQFLLFDHPLKVVSAFVRLGKMSPVGDVRSFALESSSAVAALIGRRFSWPFFTRWLGRHMVCFSKSIYEGRSAVTSPRLIPVSASNFTMVRKCDGRSLLWSLQASQRAFNSASVRTRDLAVVL